jgi:hypothetical protein
VTGAARHCFFEPVSTTSKNIGGLLLRTVAILLCCSKQTLCCIISSTVVYPTQNMSSFAAMLAAAPNPIIRIPRANARECMFKRMCRSGQACSYCHDSMPCCRDETKNNPCLKKACTFAHVHDFESAGKFFALQKTQQAASHKAP